MPDPPPIAAELLQTIVCPQCRQALALHPDAVAGVSLRCTGCANVYPIVDGIPILLIDRAAAKTSIP